MVSYQTKGFSMPNQDFVYVTFVLDETGSMQSLMPEPINGFNRYLDDQKALDGKCTLRLVKFDSNRYTVAEHPIADFPRLSPTGTDPRYTYQPGAMTPLWDTVSRSIDETGKTLDSMTEDEKPRKVVFIILTDGQENASQEKTAEDVKSKIINQTNNYQWEFIYLGVGLDKFAHGLQAGAAGVASAGTYTAPATILGLQASYRTASVVTSTSRQ
jgi:hypothetical protein